MSNTKLLELQALLNDLVNECGIDFKEALMDVMQEVNNAEKPLYAKALRELNKVA